MCYYISDIYDNETKHSRQRLSNNSEPDFTEQKIQVRANKGTISACVLPADPCFFLFNI